MRMTEPPNRFLRFVLPSLGLALLFSSVLLLDSSLADHLYSSSRFYLYGGALLFALSLLAAKVRNFAFNWADASCLLFGAYALLQYWLIESMAPTAYKSFLVLFLK